MNVQIEVPEIEVQIETSGGEWVDKITGYLLVEKAYEILAERHADELQEIATKLFKGQSV